MTWADLTRGKLIMAPMTRGTDLPFRRLLVRYGAEVCVGEMAYAHKVVKDSRMELPLLRRHADEHCFGVQLAGKRPEVMAEASRIAADRGADFIDVNMGCPIDDTTRKGFGAALLPKPGKVERIVAAMCEAVDLPITVKLRLGWSAEKPTFIRVAQAAERGGASAITLHGRSRNQRYRKAADWGAVKELVSSVALPVIGNGDIYGWSDAVERRAESGCHAVMIGRWALSKPWVFRDFRDQKDWQPSPEERLGVIREYVELCREALGDDERGRPRVRRFLTFHQDFFCRFRRNAGAGAVNSDDPRDWGDPPANDLEAWLCRSDLGAVEALCDWLVDGKECEPPPLPPEGARRAVKSAAYG